MGLETASAEECTALVDEINELVRRAGLKDGGGGAGGGGSSSRGKDLFDMWVRSSEAGHDADTAPAAAASAEIEEGSGAEEGARARMGIGRSDAPKALLTAGVGD